MKRFWVLGAPDPEMEMIEQTLVACGEEYAYALCGDQRVHPGTAYRADGLSAPIPDGAVVVAVECGGPAIPDSALRVDHHRPGDPGYGIPDGTGARPHPVHDMPPVLVRPEYHDYWQAVTDVPCPCCKTGTIRWAEAGYVPGYRICDGCGKHFTAGGSAEAPTLIELED